MKPWWLLVLNFLAQYVVVYLLWQKINGSVPRPGFQHCFSLHLAKFFSEGIPLSKVPPVQVENFRGLA